MIDSALKTIKKHNMISPGDDIVIGLSGGADSVCLFHLLLALSHKMNLSVTAVHVNHGIRGEEALRDEKFAIKLCEENKVKLEVFHVSAEEYSVANKISVEEAGRILRYESFNRISGNRSKIAVAHNKNDLAETVIFNLCRGSGTTGLSGIPPVRGNIIRPLLYSSRLEIEEYLSKNGLEYITDSTNESNDYSRNRIRNIVIPILEANVNTGVIDTIASASVLVREEDNYLNQLAEKAYSAMEKCGGLAVDYLAGLDQTIAKRVIRLFLNESYGLKDITSAHVNDIYRLALGQSGKKICLPKGLTAIKQYNTISFSLVKIELPVFSAELALDTEIYVPYADIYVYASLKEFSASIGFDRSKIEKPVVRSRLNGDLIYFNSIGGHKKIKKFFTDRKTPPAIRNACVFIACGSNIVCMYENGKIILSDYFKGENVETDNKLFIRLWNGKEQG